MPKEYLTNPKMEGSGMLACIPQQGRCPNNCDHCFFQGHNRSYLKPIEEKTPNIPDIRDVVLYNRVVRVNDGNDSNHQRDVVIQETKHFPMKFYNTAINKDLAGFVDPVVLTINPGKMTDKDFYIVDPIPTNLMFVRIRTNMWNMNEVVRPAVKYYTDKKVPVVLTFMAYYDNDDEKYPEEIPEQWRGFYMFRKRTLNAYFAITTLGWEIIMNEFKYNNWLYSCSKMDGEKGTYKCHRCGNCLREYFYTMEKIRSES